MTAQLNHSWCVTLGDLYILPNFATVSTSTGLPCMIVAWGGVEQWSDRNPKGTASLLQIHLKNILKKTKITKYKKNTKEILKNTKKNAFSETHWS